MTENMKKFLATVSENAELRAKANIMSKEELIAMAKELGIALTEKDFAQPSDQLEDDELTAVTGGGGAPLWYPHLDEGDNDSTAGDSTCTGVISSAGQS